MKPTQLTEGQKNQRDMYRAWAFAAATCTEPADRPRAETAARYLAKASGMSLERIVWVASPQWCTGQNNECIRRELTGSLNDTFLDITDSFGASFSESLYVSRDAQARKNALYYSLRDAGWVAMYAFGRELGVRYPPEVDERLRLYEDLQTSCFALCLAPHAAILCERPLSCTTHNGKLVEVTWRRMHTHVKTTQRKLDGGPVYPGDKAGQ